MINSSSHCVPPEPLVVVGGCAWVAVNRGVPPLESPFHAEGGMYATPEGNPSHRAKHMSQVTKPTSHLESWEVGGWAQGNYSKLLLGLSSSPSLRQSLHSQSIPSSVESTHVYSLFSHMRMLPLSGPSPH